MDEELIREEEERMPIHFSEDYEPSDYIEGDPDGSLSIKNKRAAYKNIDPVITEDTKNQVNYAEKYSKALSIRKATRWITAALFIVLALVGAYMFSEFNYADTDGGVKIEQYDGTFVHIFVKVPEEIDGKKVVELCDWSFYHLGQMRTLKLPDSLKRIGDNCFGDSVWFHKADIGNGVEEIGSKAFAGCSNLRELKLPESLKKIGSAAFERCTIKIKAPHEPEYYGYTPDEGVTWIIE